MTEKQYERRDIILSLLGERLSIGETNYDDKVLKNLDFVEDVLICIVEDLNDNISYKGCEYSRNEIKEKSKKILETINEISLTTICLTTGEKIMNNVKIIENTRQAKDEYGYMFGSDTFYLTPEMIEALLNGKCIAGDDGVYVTFIEIEGGNMCKTTGYDRYDDFLKQYEELCIKTGITISHEDSQGAFILESFDIENLRWMKDAIRK